MDGWGREVSTIQLIKAQSNITQLHVQANDNENLNLAIVRKILKKGSAGQYAPDKNSAHMGKRARHFWSLACYMTLLVKCCVGFLRNKKKLVDEKKKEQKAFDLCHCRPMKTGLSI
ncbi:3-galactosyl-O-glycosyl-glycoprotein beta-1,6-N-acetylglucosaminyltransferase,Beta-1 [Trichinella spiralis]|uniref:3-galactosyl-O-glycosyl-glycoprotein beta-1,6-N-acetylglucosaminyltransferase,Beta-1 n=1 Tax=Trichinella spiralis TaxID=6334 RepID=A0ABR3KIQ2_TRISP